MEGSAATLKYLADLILAVVSDDDCGFQLDPRNKAFSKLSEFGLYIHRLPCVNELPKKRGSRSKQR